MAKATNREWNTYVRALTDNELDQLIVNAERGITEAGIAGNDELVRTFCEVREKLCDEHMRRNEENDHLF